MIQSSLDLFYIVLAFCILWLTIFLVWGLYYLIMILRDARHFVKIIREKVDLVEETFKFAKEKLQEGTTYLTLIAKGIGEMLGYMKTKEDKRRRK